MLLGGEAVSDTVWAALRDTEGTYGYNLYGPTEYTINTLGGGTLDSDTPTVGRPIREHPRATSSTPGCGRCRTACPGSCTSPVSVWRAATSTGPA